MYRSFSPSCTLWRACIARSFSRIRASTSLWCRAPPRPGVLIEPRSRPISECAGDRGGVNSLPPAFAETADVRGRA